MEVLWYIFGSIERKSSFMIVSHVLVGILRESNNQRLE